MRKEPIQKRVTAGLAVALLLSAVPAMAVTLTVDPAEAFFTGENLQTITVSVDAVEDLLGASVTLGFDPAVVTPVAVAPGGLLGGGACPFFIQWTNDEDFVDTVEVDTALLGCTVDGGGVLFSVTFAGNGAGTSPLVLTEALLRDSGNNALPVDTVGGNLTYLPEITAHLSFQPEAILFDQEGTCEVCLELTGVEDFLGMSVVMGFDPAVIRPVAVQAGQALEDQDCGFFLDWINADEFIDTIAIDTALLGCHAAMDGPVVCVTFQGVQSGESPLTWLEFDVRDGANGPVPVLTHDSTVLFNAAVATTPTVLGRLKAVYR